MVILYTYIIAMWVHQNQNTAEVLDKKLVETAKYNFRTSSNFNKKLSETPPKMEKSL